MAIGAYIKRVIDPDSNDVIAWDFDESWSSTTWANTGVGSNGDLTYSTGTAFTLTPGRITDSMLSFRESTRLYTPYSSPNPSSISVSAWVQINKYADSSVRRILYKYAYQAETWVSPYSVVEFAFNNTLVWLHVKGGSSTSGASVTATLPTLGSWFHFGGTYDETTGEMVSYLNGAEVNTNTTDTGGVYYPANGRWYIGAQPSSTSECADVQLSAVRVANIVRPSTYFQRAYNLGMGYVGF